MNHHLIHALQDNFIWIIHNEKDAVIIDPSESAPIIDWCESTGKSPSQIFITHHHADHLGGVRALKEKYGCAILGPAEKSIPSLDTALQNGMRIATAIGEIEVIAVPGHTRTHLAFYSSLNKTVLTGDTLFWAGCGRLFEGSAEEMWNSLLRLRNLPGNTCVYPGHEYTLDNLEFALSLEPNNEAVANRLNSVRLRIQENLAPTISTISLERESNPFLRADDPIMKQALGMRNAADYQVFAEIRNRKNTF